MADVQLGVARGGGGRDPPPPLLPLSTPDAPESERTKTCSKCGKTLPMSEFQPTRGTRETNQCSTCRLIRSTSKRTSVQADLSPPHGSASRPTFGFITPTVASTNRSLSHGIPPPIASGPLANVLTTAQNLGPTTGPPTLGPTRRQSARPSDAVVKKARTEQANISRANRAKKRGGEDPPATPSLSALVALLPGYQYFECGACGLARANDRIERGTRNCTYCSLGSGTLDDENKDNYLQWCIGGSHEVPQSAFAFEGCTYRTCNPCRLQREANSPISSPQAAGESARSGRDSPAQRRLAAQQNNLLAQDPPINPADPNFSLTAPALTERDWQYVKDFHEELAKDTMEICPRCRERWFDVRLTNGICSRCRRRDKNVTPGEPFLMSAENNMDPGPADDQLPALTQVEEMLIARVHVFIEIWQIRGQQYKYTGHVVNFLRDTGKIYDQLPLLPRNLDIVVLRPANTSSDPRLQRQFTRDFRVRRRAVRHWLTFLKRYHPGYRDIVVDEATLTQLPEDGSVLDDMVTQEAAVEPTEEQPGEALPEEEDSSQLYQAAAVPNLLAEHQQIEDLRQQVAGEGLEENPQMQKHITMAPFRSTPISEFNRSQQLLSWAFPTLFTRGQGDFCMPRMRTVSYAAYVEHLMKYEDGRFARHPRFRYVVFNTLMRQQVNTRSSFFVKKFNPDSAFLSIEDLKAAFASDSPAAQALLASIVRYAGNLRGTRPFWNGKRSNLMAYVRTLQCPGLFLTFSAADYHWDSLQRHMPRYGEWLNGTESERIKITRDNLRENPHIAAYHFYRRFEAFMEKVIKPKFNVVDWWNRYEWQGRGSTHNHGFTWCHGPLPPPVSDESEEDRAAFAQFWGVHVSAVNPELHRQQPPDERSPLSLAPHEQENSFALVSSILNRCQVHMCSATYCLRKKKGSNSNELECRFYSPWPLRDLPIVTKEFNPKHWVFAGVRNDPRLNHYNRTVSFGWLANTDVSPCTSKDAVVNYIGKYATKEEKKTTSYTDLLREVLPYVNSSKPLLSLVSKVMNKLLGERDWSAQEICHLLLNLPLQAGSRIVVNVDCRPEHQQPVNFTIEDGEVVSGGLSPLQKYKRRDMIVHEDLTYLDFLRQFDYRVASNIKRRTRAPARILNYFPRYKPDPKGEQWEDYCRVKLMLHHSFTDFNDLYTIEETATTYHTYAEAYHACLLMHDHPQDYLDEPEPEVDEDEFGDGELDDEALETTWEELARELPNRDATRLEDPDLLGEREMDRVDWSSHVGTYPTLAADWWDEMKAAYPADQSLGYASQAMVDGLSPKQRLVYDTVMDHFERKIDSMELDGNSEPSEQLLVHVDGRAGTGKSHVIMLVSAHLQQKAEAARLPNPIIRSAPTGVAAHGISGRTLHSLFRLPIKTRYADLSSSNLAAVQASLKGCYYLVIDEKSMISLRQLSWIDMRCRQALPQYADCPFGGLNVLLCGDFYQLPPVGERPLYNDKQLKDIYEIQGRAIYQQFTKTIELDVILRQQGPEQQPFREALDGLRDNNVTKKDWQTLSSRVQSVLLPAEVERFKDALRIYGKKGDVQEYNHTKLRDIGLPVLAVNASHEGSTAESASTEEGANLHARLPICIGARIMLVENLWTERGLVNGALGTIHDIIWEAGADWRKDPPLALLIAFDKYEGPGLTTTDDGKQVVPIFRSTREFARGVAICRRTQFPMTVAYAITIHKSQGITVDRAVLNIADRDFVSGLSYVAVSRVKTLAGLLFEEAFDYQRFKSTGGDTAIMRAADAARRRQQHL